jgi:hypothetical protein
MTRRDIEQSPFWVFAPTRWAIDNAIFKAGEVLRVIATHFDVEYQDTKVADNALGQALVHALRERESAPEPLGAG